ncbi:MAG: hypothetical protein JWM80_6501 [Cyanobacteria bacterium RYN_339]|nr:hypothetical protein [Cyanobacteria bacterium RYN_339]
MKLGYAFVAAALAVGCNLPNSTPVASVDLSKVVMARTGPDAITIMGKPGAISGAKTTTVTLTIGRAPSPSPKALTLLHFGDHLPITSTYALVDEAGGFPATVAGDADHVVKTGDELGLTPQNGTVQAGYTVFSPVP